MGQGRGRWRCVVWGGISLGAGTLAYALFSSSSAGCSTNVVVLTHSAVTARGCAASSVVSHTGVGLIVLGAVLLLGSFALALRSRRQVAVAPVSAPVTVVGIVGESDVPAPGPSTPLATVPEARVFAALDDVVAVESELDPDPSALHPVEPEPVGTRRPIAPGDDVDEPADEGLLRSVVRLPPGWYGNPDIPGKPVQWWDGTKLTDGPR